MTEQTKKHKRRLGKGLNSLLTKPVEVTPPVTRADPLSIAGDQGGKSSPVTTGAKEYSVMVSEGLVYVPVENVIPNPRQPRQVFDDEALSALADSIKTAGLMQPIMIRKSSQDDRFEIVAGERRWRAA